jgi:predicted permease
VDEIMGALRDVIRRWRRRPAFATLAVLMLTVGLAAPTAIFSVVNAVLLLGPPWQSPEQLVLIHGVVPDRRLDPARAVGWDRALLSWPTWEALKDSRAFESVAAWLPALSMTVGHRALELTSAMEVSSNFLPTLGVRLGQGRQFSAADDEGPTDGVIISHEAWRQRFGGEPDVLGRVVVLGWAWAIGSNGASSLSSRTVIGVLPPGFEFQDSTPEFLLPIGSRASSERAYPHELMHVIVRLPHGTSLAAAQSAADAVVRANERTTPTQARVVPLATDETADAPPTLWLLLGASGALLAIACASVIGLVLSDARARRHQLAIRMALGADAQQVRRALAAEYVCLSVVAGVAALLVAVLTTQALVAAAPGHLPRLDEVGVNPRVAAATIGIGLLIAGVLGLGPGLWLSRTPPTLLLAEGGRDGFPARHAGQRWLVGSQIALAVVLLLIATTFGQALFAARGKPLGFDPSNVAVAATTYLGSRFGEGSVVAAVRTLDDQVLAVNVARTSLVLNRLAELPGVVEVAAASGAPIIRGPQYVRVRSDGAGREEPVQWSVVSDRYFQAMRIPIIVGRAFQPSDGPGDHLAVVSAEFERRFFAQGAVGQRFMRTYPSRAGIPYMVIGVVPDVRVGPDLHEGQPAFYALDRQISGVTHFIVRTDGGTADVLPAIRSAIGEADSQLMVTSITTMGAALARSTAEESFRGSLAAIFAAAAILLAAMGVYGLTLRATIERRREFGIRVALGASAANVSRQAMRALVPVVTVAAVVGVAAGAAAVQLAHWLVPGMPQLSVILMAIDGAAMAGIALLAALPGAIRAGQQAPLIAIRG